MGRQELGGEARSGGVQTVPEHDPRSLQFLLEACEKTDHVTSLNVDIGVQAEIKAHAVATGGNAQGGDHGDFAMMGAPLDQNRGLAAGSPAAAYQGGHEQATFVQKNQPSVQTPGFFLSLGQTCLTHCRMPSSSRSTA
jgi:hypothetical protein